MSFYDVLSKKIVVEILIRNNFLHVKCPLKEIHRRNFDKKKEFYVSNIKLGLLFHVVEFLENPSKSILKKFVL